MDRTDPAGIGTRRIRLRPQLRRSPDTIAARRAVDRRRPTALADLYRRLRVARRDRADSPRGDTDTATADAPCGGAVRGHDVVGGRVPPDPRRISQHRVYSHSRSFGRVRRIWTLGDCAAEGIMTMSRQC